MNVKVIPALNNMRERERQPPLNGSVQIIFGTCNSGHKKASQQLSQSSMHIIKSGLRKQIIDIIIGNF